MIANQEKKGAWWGAQSRDTVIGLRVEDVERAGGLSGSAERKNEISTGDNLGGRRNTQLESGRRAIVTFLNKISQIRTTKTFP